MPNRLQPLVVGAADLDVERPVVRFTVGAEPAPVRGLSVRVALPELPGAVRVGSPKRRQPPDAALDVAERDAERDGFAPAPPLAPEVEGSVLRTRLDACCGDRGDCVPPRPLD